MLQLSRFFRRSATSNSKIAINCLPFQDLDLQPVDSHEARNHWRLTSITNSPLVLYGGLVCVLPGVLPKKGDVVFFSRWDLWKLRTHFNDYFCFHVMKKMMISTLVPSITNQVLFSWRNWKTMLIWNSNLVSLIFVNFREKSVSQCLPPNKTTTHYLLSCSLHRTGYLQINLAPHSQPQTKLA